jgi:hypothetical protein
MCLRAYLRVCVFGDIREQSTKFRSLCKDSTGVPVQKGMLFLFCFGIFVTMTFFYSTESAVQEAHSFCSFLQPSVQEAWLVFIYIVDSAGQIMYACICKKCIIMESLYVILQSFFLSLLSNTK